MNTALLTLISAVLLGCGLVGLARRRPWRTGRRPTGDGGRAPRNPSGTTRPSPPARTARHLTAPRLIPPARAARLLTARLSAARRPSAA